MVVIKKLHKKEVKQALQNGMNRTVNIVFLAMYGSRFVVRHAGIPLGFFQNSYRLDGTGVNHRRQSTGMEADHRTTPVRPVCHHAVGTDGNLPAARLQKIQRNDILVFNFPHPNTWDKIEMHILKYYIKRCVGLPGDTLSIRNGFSM